MRTIVSTYWDIACCIVLSPIRLPQELTTDGADDSAWSLKISTADSGLSREHDSRNGI